MDKRVSDHIIGRSVKKDSERVTYKDPERELIVVNNRLTLKANKVVEKEK